MQSYTTTPIFSKRLLILDAILHYYPDLSNNLLCNRFLSYIFQKTGKLEFHSYASDWPARKRCELLPRYFKAWRQPLGSTGKRLVRTTATGQQRNMSMSSKGSTATDPVQNASSSVADAVANNASILARKPLQHYNRRLAQAPPSAATLRCTQLLMETSKSTHRRNASQQSCSRTAAACSVRTNVESTSRNAPAAEPTIRRSFNNTADKFSALAPLPSHRCTDIWGAATGLDDFMATVPLRPKSAPRISMGTDSVRRHHPASSGTKRARCVTTDVGSNSNTGKDFPATDATAARPAKRKTVSIRLESINTHSLHQQDPSMMKPTPRPRILTQRESSLTVTASSSSPTLAILEPVNKKGSSLLRTETSASSLTEPTQCNVSLSILSCTSTTTTRRPVRRRSLPTHNCDINESTLHPGSSVGQPVVTTTSDIDVSTVNPEPRPTLTVMEQPTRPLPLSGMAPPKSRHVSAAWAPIARPAATAETGATASRRNTNKGNYVRLNLRNKAGSCRGARNVKARSKAAHQREQLKQQRNNRAAEDNNDSNGFGGGGGGSFTAAAPLAATNGLDTIDDYVDGVLQAPPSTSRSSKQRARSSAIPLCRGHSQPCKRLVVKKTGPNKGRVFFVCGGARGEQCHHFEWADDTVQVCNCTEREAPTFALLCQLTILLRTRLQAAQEALLRNKSLSGFIARQVAAHTARLKCLTVPELRQWTKQNGLADTGTKKQLVLRLAVWLRDQVAQGTKGLVGESNDKVNDTGDCDESIARGEDDDSSCISSHSACREEDDESDQGSTESSDDELELTGESCGRLQQWIPPNQPPVGAEKLTDAPDSQVEGGSPTNSDRDNDHGLHSINDAEIFEGDQTQTHNSLMMAALRQLFGFSSFRPGQEWAIGRCLSEQRSLLVAPTGFGKSLCFAVPAAMLDGVCIVVSPLLSLIQDQMQILPARLPAVTLSGQMSSSALAATLDDIVRGRVKVVFVSPERLTSASFRRLFRPKWNPDTQTCDRLFPAVSLLCVDEAHCLSQWAHNFRPSYLRLQSVMDMMAPRSVLAITATAGPRVVDDICRTLRIEQPTVESTTANSIPSTETRNGLGVLVSKTDRDNIDVKSFFLDTQEERLAMVSVSNCSAGKACIELTLIHCLIVAAWTTEKG
jgi:DEAD/DEAH box helicase/GRF zinc finger